MVEDHMDVRSNEMGSIFAVVRIVMMTAASTIAVGLLVYTVAG